MTTNLTVTNSVFQGETRLGTMYWPTSVYGPPPQSDCTDTNACHSDCVHMTGIDGFTFAHNIMYNCQTQALFLENQNGGYSRNGTVVDNYLGSLGSCSFCAGGSTGQVNTTRGTWLVAFNTGNAGIGFHGPSTIQAGTSITFVGNYGPLGNSGDDTNPDGCGFAPAGTTVAYQYNVWTNDGGATNSPCGTGDTVTPMLTVAHVGNWNARPPDNGTNYDLNGTHGTNPADDRVPAALCTTITTRDVHGNVRPSAGGAFCDAGANER
jgi:hypothetical protein